MKKFQSVYHIKILVQFASMNQSILCILDANGLIGESPLRNFGNFYVICIKTTNFISLREIDYMNQIIS